MTNEMTLDKATRKQIAALRFKRGRPLLVCDVDEVVLHFLRGLEDYLQECGCWLDPASFALNGNVKDLTTGEPVSTDRLRQLLLGFFADRSDSLDPIDGAADALDEMSRDAEIVMLTNMPMDFYDNRVRNLHRHGMPYPVVVNSGPKGPAVRALADQMDAPVIFIDDVPGNIISVRDTLPASKLVHFMQDHRFSLHVEPIEGVTLRSDNWRETRGHISGLLARNTAPR